MNVNCGDGKTITIEELALKLCNEISGDECAGCYDGSCPAAAYCRHGRNGMIVLLRKVVDKWANRECTA